MPRRVFAPTAGRSPQRKNIRRGPQRTPEPELETSEVEQERAALIARWAGSGGLCRDGALDSLLLENNLRITPLVDKDFLQHWLLLLAQAIAAENWERLQTVARECYHEAQAERKTKPRRDEILALPLAMTRISMRTLEWLEREGIRTVHDLLNRRRDELMAIPQFGPHCLQECLAALRELGLGESG